MKHSMILLTLIFLLSAPLCALAAHISLDQAPAPALTVPEVATPSFAALLDALAATLSGIFSGGETEGMSELPMELWDFDPDLRIGDRLLDGPALFVPAA